MSFFGRLFGGNKVEDFWAWFSTNAPRFAVDPQHLPLDEITTRLRRIHPELAFVIGRGAQTGAHELEISADGRRAMIPIVTDVVAKATPIAGWVVHAFRQPHPGLQIRCGEHTLDADSVYFDSRPNGTALDVAIFVEGFDRDPEGLGGVVFMLLDSTVGELAVMTKILGLDFLDGSARTPNARPLRELGAELAKVAGRAS